MHLDPDFLLEEELRQVEERMVLRRLGEYYLPLEEDCRQEHRNLRLEAELAAR